MPDSHPNAGFNYRYSTFPQSHYVKKTKKVGYGTASSALLDTLQAWNLAYLSFDFENKLTHPDPHFTVHVRRSIQTRLTDGTQDLVEPEPFLGLVGSLLLLPAPRFTHLIKPLELLKSLPLYVAYGESWLETITARSWICGYGHEAETHITDFSKANEILGKCRLTRARD